MKITKNFTLEELVKSSTAIRLGIDNTPNASHIENLRILCNTQLQHIRDRFGPVKVNSGYRSVPLCKALKSDEHSFHAFGMAADIEAYDESISNFNIFEFIHKNLNYTELILEYCSPNNHRAGWVHTAFNINDKRKIIKLKDEEHDYTILSFDEVRDIYTKNTNK